MDTDFLIVGAGPFGLAAAAEADELGIDHVVVGDPMGFWHRHMPRGMVLRSGRDWNLDPTEHTSLAGYLARTRAVSVDAPIPISEYLAYVEWLIRELDIVMVRKNVVRLDDDGERLRATADDGTSITARRVLLALGFGNSANIPPEVVARLGPVPHVHTGEVTEPARYAGELLLVVGGRQSAFETSALLAEAGAASVDIAYRHDTPAFVPSDWSWVTPLIRRFETEPHWYHGLDDAERADLGKRFWAEGRLKLESWLAERLRHPSIRLHPKSEIEKAVRGDDGFAVALTDGRTLAVDRAILATGYRMDIDNVPMLADGNLAGRIETADGFPVLDDVLQTSVPGLYMTSFAATRDFGPFFAFTAAAGVAARIVGHAVARSLEE